MKRSTKARILLVSGLAFIVIAPLFYLFVCVPGDFCVYSCGKICEAGNINLNIQPFDFESEAVDNGFHNARVGGLLAYKDKTLYAINEVSDTPFGLYAINKDSAQKIHSGGSSKTSVKTLPLCMYQYGNKIYALEPADDYESRQSVSVFDPAAQTLSDSGLGMDVFDKTAYISDDLLVWNDFNDNKTAVKYKGRDIAVDKEISAFDVAGGKIYYINSYGNLYCLDPTTGKNVMINQKDRSKIKHSYPTQMICLDNYCYFFSNDLNLCGFSFDSGEFEYDIVLDEEIYSLNSYGGKVYAAAKSGIYELDRGECKKISDLKTKEIYIFDDQYIFTHDKNGNVFRLDPKTGDTDEII